MYNSHLFRGTSNRWRHVPMPTAVLLVFLPGIPTRVRIHSKHWCISFLLAFFNCNRFLGVQGNFLITFLRRTALKLLQFSKSLLRPPFVYSKTSVRFAIAIVNSQSERSCCSIFSNINSGMVFGGGGTFWGFWGTWLTIFLMLSGISGHIALCLARASFRPLMFSILQ